MTGPRIRAPVLAGHGGRLGFLRGGSTGKQSTATSNEIVRCQDNHWALPTRVRVTSGYLGLPNWSQAAGARESVVRPVGIREQFRVLVAGVRPLEGKTNVRSVSQADRIDDILYACTSKRETASDHACKWLDGDRFRQDPSQAA
jgi:hypothetical protein